MKVVVMGCGRVGAALAAELSNEGHSVLVFDIDPSTFRFLPDDFRGTTYVGSGIDLDVLEKIGVADADVFVSTTRGDNRNVMAAQMAKHIFHVPKVICRIYDPQRRDMYIPLGIDAVSPTTLVAQMLREKLGV